MTTQRTLCVALAIYAEIVYLEAWRLIREGDADVFVAGGSEAAIVPLGIGGFAAMKALSTRNDEPTKASRPWDKDRDGFVMGEGAGIVVLEELEHAKKRGAKIYGEVVGYGMTADAYHMSAPLPNHEQAQRSMRIALQKAGLNASDVDYINAHGTSTPVGDIAEVRAVKAVLGEDAKRVPVSSTKSMTGHLLGAAGVVETIVCIKAIETGIVPPTINLDNPDEECDLDFVPKVAREVKPKVTLKDRVAEADRRREAARLEALRAPVDRVAEADRKREAARQAAGATDSAE